MAFVVVLFRGEEVARQELREPIVIGRSPEVDISVRDILLSRRHCRIAPLDKKNWTVEDLGSKNGTRIGGELVQSHVLKDGTSIRIGGKTQVKFYAGSVKPAPAGTPKPKRRPADPFEALSGTVAGFEYKPDGPERDLSRLPTPVPKPADPRGYARDDVYTMLTEIASSSWDSIYATASEPAAVMVAGQKHRPSAGVAKTSTDLPPRRRNVVTDASLQVDHVDPVAEASTIDATPSIDNAPSVDKAPSADAAPTTPAASKRWYGSWGGLMRQVKHVVTARFLRRAL
jgi:hypothetical protein